MRSHLALRLLAFVAVAVTVLLGIWVTGGVITNDFATAMALTTAWMAVAGIASLLVAVRSRRLRWPVLAGYVVTAAVAGAYLGSSVLFDKEVDERVATAGPVRALAPEPGGERRPAVPRNVQLLAGRFEAVRHAGAGDARVIDLAHGGRVLTFTRFEVDNGPDLRVYLVPGAAATEEDVRDPVDLGALKGNKGDQQYAIPAGVDLDRRWTVVVWCRAFSVLFARAPLAT